MIPDTRDFRQEIQELLLNVLDIEDEDRRKQIAQAAGFPEKLYHQVDWGKQPADAFVAHLIDRTLRWGSLSDEDKRHSLIEYLRATEEFGGPDHRGELRRLLGRLSAGLRIVSTKAKEITFVNREQDISRLTDEADVCPRYTIHAPAGYGKTWLLERLQREFENKGWLAVQATLRKDTSMQDLVNGLLGSVSCPAITGDVSDTAYLARQLSEKLKKQWEQLGKEKEQLGKERKGIVLLIDLEDLPTEIPQFPHLIGDWLPVVTRDILGLEFFSSGNYFRTFVGGRFFDRDMSDLLSIDGAFEVYSLKPFEARVLEHCVNQYLPDVGPEWQTELWSTLFYLTGGHPRCFSRILKLYWQQSKPEPEYFFSEKSSEIQDMVRDEVDHILKDFSDETRQLLLVLSPYRYLSYAVLEDILNYRESILEWAGSIDLLSDTLTQTHLVSWDFGETNHLLRDDISRRIMTLYLRHSKDPSPPFSTRCLQAKEIYKQLLLDEEDRVLTTRWAMEYLFSSLQAATPDIETAKGRERLRLSFWGSDDEDAPTPGTDLHECFSVLADGRQGLRQIRALQRAFRSDREWEFSFTVNYFLRDEIYDTKWFRILLAKTRSFLSDRFSG